VEIQNKSTVDFGSVTKVEIYWDNATNPTQFDVDDFPTPVKIYKHIYPNFQSPLTRTFQIRFRSFSGGTCVDDEIKTVTVNASPRTQFLPMSGICVDAASRQITEASEIGGVPGTFFYSGPGVSTTGLFNPATAGVGTHTIRYTFVSDVGCRDSITQTIEVWPRPVAKFSSLLPACERNQIFFADSSVSNATSITTWNWNFNDGSPIVTLASNNNVNHSFATANTYNVGLEVINNRGCRSLIYSLPVKINPLPQVDFSLPNVCLPAGTASFTDLSTIADGTQSSFRYRWDFGDGFAAPVNSDTSLLRNPIYTYRNLGPYTVQLKVTSSNNCVDSLSKELLSVYPQPKASFSSTDSLCLGTVVAFADNSNGNGSTINRWRWSFGNTDSSFVQNPNYTYRSQGMYNVELIVYTDKGCISDTASKTIDVWDFPVISAGPDLFVLEDGFKRITGATATGAGLQYLWSPPSFLDTVTNLNPLISRPADDITYRLTVTGRGGCSVFDEMVVTVLRFPKIPNTFTPNNDGINDFWEIRNLSDYPDCIVEVYNTAGSLVYRSLGYATPWDGRWKGQALPIGTYYYVIDPKNGRTRIAGYVTLLR
jgi:gliding motility-associated-like protein